jgi:hypothetical protein
MITLTLSVTCTNSLILVIDIVFPVKPHINLKKNTPFHVKPNVSIVYVSVPISLAHPMPISNYVVINAKKLLQTWIASNITKQKTSVPTIKNVSTAVYTTI